jgi:hypothetical protein
MTRMVARLDARVTDARPPAQHEDGIAIEGRNLRWKSERGSTHRIERCLLSPYQQGLKLESAVKEVSMRSTSSQSFSRVDSAERPLSRATKVAIEAANFRADVPSVVVGSVSGPMSALVSRCAVVSAGCLSGLERSRRVFVQRHPLLITRLQVCLFRLACRNRPGLLSSPDQRS